MKTYSKKIVVLSSFALLMAAFIWGVGFIFVKTAVAVIPPLYMLAFRFGIASLGLLVIFHRKLKNITKINIKHGLWIGFWQFLGYALQTWACRYTTAGKNAFITAIYVVLVPLFAWLIFKKRPDIYCVIAALMAIFALALLSLNGEGGINVGDFLTFLCGICYAIQVLYVGRFAQKEDVIVLTMLQMFTMAILSIVSAPIIDGAFPMAVFEPQMIGSMLFLGLGASMVAFLLQNVGQKYTPSNTAALLLSMESVFGALSSVIVLGEVMNGKMILGCVIMMVAIILAETKFSFLPFMKKVEEVEC